MSPFMKSTALVLLSLLVGFTVSAQLMITPGAQFSIFSDTKLTLHNTNLINNGNLLLATTSPVSFTGNVSSFIGGDQAVRFFGLEINKTGNQSVTLQKTIGVGSGVFFISGSLNLNGFDLDLETSGHLDGEREDSRVVGPNGGEVLFSVDLNSPANSNPANLGMFISSTQNLGNVKIRRGHRPQNGTGLSNSISLYYDITPANNSNLNATLRFKYLDAELNNLDETSLVFFQSQDAINWTNLGFNSRDAVVNLVEKTGIGSFARFTLSGAGNALPVRFSFFTVRCDKTQVQVNWKTAQEQNSSHFNIERSDDGLGWRVIGDLPAAGNSNIERSYSFTDNNPAQNSFYRIAEYDLDARVQYSAAVRSTCNATKEAINLWPNPVHDNLFINIVAAAKSQAVIKVIDSRGALVRIQKNTFLAGSNQFVVDMRALANGIYSLSVEWNNGQMKKMLQVVKQ
jgi:Secretion system C-terminal sorting domain